MMILGIDKYNFSRIEQPIDNYADKLVWYMATYLDKLQNDMQSFSAKANKKEKIGLRWLLSPNPNKEFERDYQRHEDEFGNKTSNIIAKYTKCIMTLVGQLAECVIVDHCCNNENINRICINIAKLMPDIYNDYADIEYDKYVAFSTSSK